MIHEILAVFAILGFIVVLFCYLKQPMIPAFVIAGIVVSPLFLGLINEAGAIADLSEMAFVIMLFIIGIEMDLDRLKKIGLVVILGGIAQVIITFGAGYLYGYLTGQDSMTCVYLGLVLAFSSTMLVVKSLSDSRDLNSLPGRVSVGMLVMQDIIAIFALAILSAKSFGPKPMVKTVLLTAGIILILVMYAREKILPWLFDFMAKDKEALTVFAISMMCLVGIFAEWMDLTLGIGAFLFGLAISGLAYRYEIAGELRPLKNTFFGVLFFASLGLRLVPADIITPGGNWLITLDIFRILVAGQIWLILGFMFLAMVIKPIIVMIIIAFLGYERSTACHVGISLGQLSEFGMVLAIYGLENEAISSNILLVVIISTTLTIIFSTYALRYVHALIDKLEWFTRWLNRLTWIKEAPYNFEPSLENDYEVAIVGHRKLGLAIADSLKKRGIRYVVVDSNPDVIHKLGKNVPFIFGNVENPEVLEKLDMEKIKTVFSSLPQIRHNRLLLEHLKQNPKANFVGIVNECDDAVELYKEGAHYVLIMFVLAGQQLGAVEKELTFDLKQILDAAPDELRKIGCAHQQELCGNCNFTIE